MSLEDYYIGNPLYKDIILSKIQNEFADTLQEFNMTVNTSEIRESIKQVIDIVLRKYQEYFVDNIESVIYIPIDEYGIDDYYNSIRIYFKINKE